MGSQQNRFPHRHQERENRKRWGGCISAVVCCLGSKKGGKRIVPANRINEANGSLGNHNQVGVVGEQIGIGIGNQSITTSLLAPPSSPASLTHSSLPSTVQSPSSTNNNSNCFLSLSASSPVSVGPFATGPYAHETQLVSPPVFSTFTTQPSTAPLTPPPDPELSLHLTTPSSPDVPFARFFSHSHSPPIAASSQDSNFFCPATFAQFYLDNPPFPHAAGRLSVSKDSDAFSNAQPTKQIRSPKQDVEELEAYRASFGFSADEIITTTQYVEISDVTDESFTITPLATDHDETTEPIVVTGLKPLKTHCNSNSDSDSLLMPVLSNEFQEHKKRPTSGVSNLSDEEDVFAKMGSLRTSRKYHVGLSSSDAEIDYRRGRSLRERKDFTWLAK